MWLCISNALRNPPVFASSGSLHSSFMQLFLHPSMSELAVHRGGCRAVHFTHAHGPPRRISLGSGSRLFRESPSVRDLRFFTPLLYAVSFTPSHVRCFCIQSGIPSHCSPLLIFHAILHGLTTERSTGVVVAQFFVKQTHGPPRWISQGFGAGVVAQFTLHKPTVHQGGYRKVSELAVHGVVVAQFT